MTATANIIKLMELDIPQLITGIFILIIGIKELVNAFGWLLSKLGIQFKWVLRRTADHDLITATAERLTRLEEQHEADVSLSIRNDKAIKTDLSKVCETIQHISQKLDDMQAKNDASEMAKLKDTIISYYKRYKELGEWTDLEAEVFWELFHSYEDRGGNGYIHTIVEPVMRELRITNPYD